MFTFVFTLPMVAAIAAAIELVVTAVLTDAAALTDILGRRATPAALSAADTLCDFFTERAKLERWQHTVHLREHDVKLLLSILRYAAAQHVRANDDEAYFASAAAWNRLAKQLNEHAHYDYMFSMRISHKLKSRQF